MVDYKIYALIVAGGKGVRMGSKLAKQYLDLEGKPVLTRTIEVFDRFEGIDDIVVVVPEKDIEYCKRNIIDPFGFKKAIHITAGGHLRQDSVLQGLQLLKEKASSIQKSIVLIHDGVRPFIDHKIINECIEKAARHGACILGIQVADTIKKSDSRLFIEKTIDRENIFLAQTPQVFKFDLILNAFEYVQNQNIKFTDDASLMELIDQKVFIVQGLKSNIKLTTSDDLDFAKFLLSKQRVNQ